MNKPPCFTDFHWHCEFTCKNCQTKTSVNNKVRYSGGSYLDYAEKSTELNDAERAILDNKEYFGPNMHYGFQCQDCGTLKTSNNYSDLQYTITTDVECDCGGELSRHYPIFCPHCKYNKVEGWDSEQYKASLKEKYEQEQKAIRDKQDTRKHGEDGWFCYDGEWIQF